MNAVASAAPAGVTLRASSPDVSEARVLAGFDRLNSGERLTLRFNGPARPWLSIFQLKRPGQFEWTPLPDREGAQFVEIERRDAPVGARRGVNEALSWDHDRLDSLDERTFAARAASDLTLAKDLFTSFAFGLRRHIRFEEELLFPEFEARGGFDPDSGPTAVMRMEHREILDLLGQIEEGVGDPAFPAERLRAELHGVLGEHNMKEEHIVYPGTDRAMTAAESDALVARIQAV